MASTSHLSPLQRDALSLQLQSRFAELAQAAAARARAVLPDAMSPAQDPDEAGQRAAAGEVDAAVADMDGSESAEIGRAMQRIHGPDYGWCIDCQAAIPFERLSAEPHALRCAACQTIHEQDLPQ
jgi:RNA polymerase-binding transcription factor DksA